MHLHSGVVSNLPLKDLALFEVLKVTFLDHSDDRVVDGPLVVKPHCHLLLQLLEGNLRTDGDSPLDRFFDPLTHFFEFNRCLALLTGEATLRGVQCRNLEEPMRFFDVSGRHYRIEVDF